jgi:uncharacterized protein (DUF1501 family)
MPTEPTPPPPSSLPALSRRRFLTGTAAALGAAALAGATHPWTRLHPASAGTRSPLRPGKGILVVVTLYGGNDGLNTLIPSADPRYRAARPTLGYQPHEVLALSDGLALHPSLTGLKALWDAGHVAVVRGVGYPEPVLSHFRSMDIWQSGSPTSALPTGILGRWLDATGTDPMRALSLSGPLPLLLRGERSSATALPAGGAGPSPADARLAPALDALYRPASERPALADLVAQSGADRRRVAHTVADLLGTASPSPGTPAGNGLAAQLDVVARLVAAGSPTRVYHVPFGGFDNHANEKQTHARLLSELDGAVSGFMKTLAGTPAGRDVVLMAYSEFGRRLAQNASGGTDHGTAGPVLVVGQSVKGGFHGDEPSLARLDNGNLRFTTDFRSVFATMLAGVVGVDPRVAFDRAVPTIDLV